MSARWMVVANGHGEYRADYTVAWIEAETADEAARIAALPEKGHINGDSDEVYVCAEDAVAAFAASQSVVVTVRAAGEGDT